MKKNLITAFLMTVATTVLLGIVYPLVVTGLAQVLFKDKANGQTHSVAMDKPSARASSASPSPRLRYFHPRPSAAGNGYDAANSGGTNLGPTNQKLIDRVQRRRRNAACRRTLAARASRPDHHFGFRPRSGYHSRRRRISGSARRARAWYFRIALRALVQQAHASARSWFAREPRVNVLELNLALDALPAKP